MKKIRLYITLFLTACLMACTEDFNEDVAAPQSYPEELQVISGFTIALDAGFTSPVVLKGLEENAFIQAVKATKTPKMAEGASVTFRLQLSDTESFTKVTDLPSQSENNAAVVDASILNEAVKELFGKAPNPRTIYLRAYVYILEGTSASQIPTPVTLGRITVTPDAQKIEPAYYLIGDMNGWYLEDITDAHKFAHSDKDVYEDPVFTILTRFNANDNFKIAPQSAKDARNWNAVLGNTDSDGFTGAESKLIAGGGYMTIADKGWAKITLNITESTYTVEVMGEMKLQLYVAGGHQGWNPATAPIVYNRNFDMKYEGYVSMNAGNEFKFTSEPNWDGVNYGDGEDGGALSTDGGAGNLTVPEDGFYRFIVNLSGNPLTYTATKTEWGLIGDATDGGWDNSTPMTLDPATGEWTATTTLTGGKEYKFRANNGWDINLGGDLNNLTYGGDNILVPADGTGIYEITLTLSDPQVYKATVVKQ